MTQGDPEFAEALKPAIAIAPMNRMGTPQEIADACLFLCSSKATFVQGAAIVSPSSLNLVTWSLNACKAVDGGYVIN